MHRIKKIVVFTEDLSYSVRKGIITIHKEIPGLSWLILVHSPTPSFLQLLRNQWRCLKHHGWRCFPDLVLSFYNRFMSGSKISVSPESIGSEFTLTYIKNLPNFQFMEFKDIHSKEAIDTITSFQPDIGLSLSAPVLRENIFTIPSLGTLNLHKGRLPEYKGITPAFWEMWNQETSVGCTVHWVDEKLYAGSVAVMSSIDCETYSTVKGLQLGLDELGCKLVHEAIIKIDRGAELNTPQNSGGRIYKQPTLKQLELLNRKINRIAPSKDSMCEKILKDLIKKTIYSGISKFHGFVVPRVTVLLYHRVTDSVRDNLTIGIEQFNRQMMLLRRYYKVLPLTELLEMETIPRTQKPAVCVTFDDGYLDNYLNAMPILLRNNIQAAFFVSTGLIGSQKQFPHDIRRGNKPIPLMKWEHLREMHKLGFTIGSHTVNHIDCAAEEESVVRWELIQSMTEIKSKLGAEDVILAYPYGGKKHMTKERLEIVKEVGFSGCLSAYGGSNVGKIDRFNVVRRGIHWEFSDASFLYAAQGFFG